MKLRTLPLAVATAAALLVSITGVVPAFADVPAAPNIDTLVSSVAGEVSGTVSVTDTATFVFVALVGASDSGEPTRFPVDLSSTNAFTLTSWGYGANTKVQAWACPTSSYDGLTCSTVTESTPFTPADADPGLSFSADATVGPTDDVTLSVSDAGNGGLLYGQWDISPSTLPARFSVDHAASGQVVTVSDGDDGVVRLYRCDNAQQDHCVEETGSPSATYQVRRTITATIGAITPVSSASPTTHFNVTTDVADPRTGTYDVEWHLESAADPGTEIPGYGTNGTPVSGALTTSGVTQNIPLDATDLPTGNYLVVGTITVVDDDFGTYTDVTMTGGTLHSGGDITPPVISSITASPTKIYPKISGVPAYKSSTKITVAGSGTPEVSAVRIYRKSTTPPTLVRVLTLSSAGTTTWNGRWWTSTGSPVPSGTYLIKVSDASGNVSPTIGQVSVSGYKLVSRTWEHTFTPVGTLSAKYVGKCSSLRSPALRGWYHSLGYYANTRCSSQTSTDSLVSTVHGIILPAAAQYNDIRVSVYGGAARAKPGSKAVIRYLHTPPPGDTEGYWVSDKPVSSTLGTHTGFTTPASGLVFAEDHSFAWGFYTGFGYQYDAKSFTVLLHYKVLG